MKKYLFFVLSIFSCTINDSENTVQTDTLSNVIQQKDSASLPQQITNYSFGEYVIELTPIEMPMRFKTGDDFTADVPTPELYQAFKLENANNPGGRILTNNHYTLLMDLIAGDVIVPALVTYTKEGIKIDSLIFFDSSYEDENMFSQETVIIDTDLTIHRYDSTFTRITAETNKLTDTNIRKFVISTDGKFIKK